jgi:hypothetical protein
MKAIRSPVRLPTSRWGTKDGLTLAGVALIVGESRGDVEKGGPKLPSAFAGL